MDCSMPGFPVLYYLSEFTQIHVHWVDEHRSLGTLNLKTKVNLEPNKIKALWREETMMDSGSFLLFCSAGRLLPWWAPSEACGPWQTHQGPQQWLWVFCNDDSIPKRQPWVWLKGQRSRVSARSQPCWALWPRCLEAGRVAPGSLSVSLSKALKICLGELWFFGLGRGRDWAKKKYWKGPFIACCLWGRQNPWGTWW